MSFITELRGAKASFASGVAWLLAAWLWFGDRVLGALGSNCGQLTSTACGRQQTRVVHLVVVAVAAIGKPGMVSALGLLALIVGGTANFVFAWLLGLKWKEAVSLLMDWPSPADVAFREAHQAEWADAIRIRGEGLTRVTVLLPALLGTVAIAKDQSWWWLVAVLPLLALGAHGAKAIRRYFSMATYVSSE